MHSAAFSHSATPPNTASPGIDMTPPDPKLTPEALFQAASPAVVKIVLFDEDDRKLGNGSGFLFNFGAVEPEKVERPDFATVLTNYHVIQSAARALVIFNDAEECEVAWVGAEDRANDLAMLITMNMKREFASIPISPMDKVAVGTRIYTISSPRGLVNTLSEGLVSGYRSRGSGLLDWMQITAPISPGSSGGPVLDGQGQAIGIAASVMEDGQNLNFAVPIHSMESLMKRPSLRPVWKGVSLKLESNRLRDQIYREMIEAFRRGQSSALVDEGIEKVLAFQARRARAGDPLGLLMEGHSRR
jgi:S1-C subfamily serine protease